MIGSYPKIYNLGHAAIVDLLLDPVLVEEKVDGSQFAFCIQELDGGLQFRSKEAIIDPDGPPKMFAKGVEAVKAVAHLLTPGLVYRGEYLEKPKHNVLAYDRVPEKNIILFDITSGLETYLSPEAKRAEAARIGFEVVPTIYEGPLHTYDVFAEMLNRQSILGGQKVEGVVIKNYGRFARDGKALMGKFVSEQYKEIHGGEWRKANPAGQDIITRLVEQLRTPARWEKAVQHLRDRGELTDSPKDIGNLIKEMIADTHEEADEMIAAQLLQWAWKGIGRQLVAGLPEWYKERLARQQFTAAPKKEDLAYDGTTDGSFEVINTPAPEARGDDAQT